MRGPKKERVSEKCVAIDRHSKELWSAIKKTSDEVWSASGKMWSGVQDQVKENEEAVLRMSEGIKKLSRDIDNYIRDFW